MVDFLNRLFGNNSAVARDSAERAARRATNNPAAPLAIAPRPIASSEIEALSEGLLSIEQREQRDEIILSEQQRQRVALERSQRTIEPFAEPDRPIFLPENALNNLNWIVNPLSTFNNTSYRWKFFLTDDRLSLESGTTTTDILNSTSNGRGVVLFETGSTGFNIKSVTINNFVGVDWWNKNAQVTEFTMVVAEPMGIALADSFFLAAQSLGVKNYLKAPYFIQLDFIGTDDNGKVIILPAMPNSQVQRLGIQTSTAPIPSQWIWRVQVKNIETQLGPGGAVHTITLRPYVEVGLTDYFLNAKTNISIDGINTVGDFLNRVREAITKQFRDNLDQHVIEEITVQPYRPITGANLPSSNPDPKTWRLTPADIRSRNLRSASFADEQKTKITIGSREAFNEVIQEVIGNTAEAQELRKFLREGRQNVDAIVLWKLRADVFVNPVNPYNYINNTYNFSIKYTIIPYETNQVVTDNVQNIVQPNRQNNAELIYQRNQTRKLIKRYDYLFTGLNTEVLDLELNLNTAWMASLPLYSGENSFGQIDPGQAISTAGRQELLGIQQDLIFLQNAQRQVSNLLAKIQAGQPVAADDVANIFQNASPRVADTRNRINQVLQRERRFFQSENSAQRARLQDIQTQITEAIDRNRTRLQADALQIRVGDEVNQTINQRVNDIRERAGFGNLNYVELLNERLDGRFDRSLPLSLRPDNFENRAEVERSGEYATTAEGRNRMVYASILNQAKTTKDFLKIDLTIKGDPYWLGNNHYSAPRTTLEPHTMNPDISDCMFLLTFKLPSGIDSNGNVKLNTADVYNGIYIVLEVKNIFEEGRFTQVLTAARDTRIQLPVNFDSLPVNLV
jgi:hypothetical protein